MNKGFDALLAKISECSIKKVAVANAQDDAVLEAVRAAKDKNIADAILVGDEDKIKDIAASKSINISDFEIIDVKDMIEAARTAVKLVHDGKADMYMKGLIDTKDFLKSV
ncbi:MAG: phosphate butyryltransferase, partial [Lachnospiraceae bacterium]|nr:phosphate butyryltransferase [Lachnospiraceae bacterium]